MGADDGSVLRQGGKCIFGNTGISQLFGFGGQAAGRAARGMPVGFGTVRPAADGVFVPAGLAGLRGGVKTIGRVGVISIDGLPGNGYNERTSNFEKEVGTMAKEKETIHKTSIGGQAVMEGVMMRGPKEIATAVRKSDGEIIIDKKGISSVLMKYKVLKLPIIRGCINFFESLIVGVKALMFSADQYDLEDGEAYEPSKFEAWLDRKFGDKIKDITIYASVVIALICGVGLFMLLPNVITGFFSKFVTNNILRNLVEGGIRIVIFLGYMILVSQMKDIQRVFEYHGAEHKTIACYEHGEELTPENARKFCRLHPRCGTSFLLIVMVVSIIAFSFLGWGPVWQRLLLRLALLPVVAGISYEAIKFAGRSENRVVQLLTKPGLWLQYLTTREPDDSQLEVAIAAMQSVLTDNKEEDKW